MSRGDAPHAVVVGAGIVGAATAYELARRGWAVTVLDRHEAAWGASGRNPGFVWLHTRAAGIQMELGLAGRRLYDELVEELDDFEFRASGGMVFFLDEAQEKVVRAFVDDRRAAGLPMELLDGAAAREACPVLPERVAGATWNPLDAHIRTSALVAALLEAAGRQGPEVRVVQGTAAVGLEVAAGRCTGARTEAGVVGGDAVVLAAGVWTPELLGPLGLPLELVPMRLQVAETEPAPFRFGPLLYGPTALKQYAFVRELPGYEEDPFWHPLERSFPGVEFLELAAQRRDGRVLLGCPMDFPGMDDRPTLAGLGLTSAVLADSLPALAGLSVERNWAGLLPQTRDALPVLGPVPGVDGLVLATGHVFGNLAGPISGRLVAQVLAGEEPDLDLSPFRADRPAVAEPLDRHGHW
ncbi:MAG: FAD-binding oxidoreductase [Actinobacteria bacterium]|nr:FAD-binding oxidoreductase [Actinomycetota bacterium]